MFGSDVKAAHFGATMTEDVATKARMSFMINLGFGISFLVIMIMVVRENEFVTRNRHHCEIHVRINFRIRSVDRMANSKK